MRRRENTPPWKTNAKQWLEDWVLFNKNAGHPASLRFNPSAKSPTSNDFDVILRSSELAGNTLDVIVENGQSIDIRCGQVLHENGQRLQSIYLIREGLVSVSLPDATGVHVEVLTLGKGDFSGLPYALNGQKSPHRSIVQVAGSAVRIAIADLSRILADHESFHGLLLETISMHCLHGSYLVACNARHSVSQRLSRWLLTASDQLGSPDIPVTHKIIAEAIGVRRAGITKEVNELQGRSILTKSRGALTIEDRHQLEQYACGCYQPVRAARMRRFEASVAHNPIKTAKPL